MSRLAVADIANSWEGSGRLSGKIDVDFLEESGEVALILLEKDIRCRR
jgi:hypothetical protein